VSVAAVISLAKWLIVWASRKRRSLFGSLFWSAAELARSSR
jgi:hypothetical protein